MDRHLILYRQGLESIQRREDTIRFAQETRLDLEHKECLFAPVLMCTSKRSKEIQAHPRLFQTTVERIRKGIANRSRIDTLLTPRTPMTSSSSGKSRTIPLPCVSVEVTKDGPSGSAQTVGKFLLYPNSNPKCIAARFARVNKLTLSQQTRLEEQLEENIKNAFPN